MLPRFILDCLLSLVPDILFVSCASVVCDLICFVWKFLGNHLKLSIYRVYTRILNSSGGKGYLVAITTFLAGWSNSRHSFLRLAPPPLSLSFYFE